MAEPIRLCIKRRATEDPPDYLLLQSAGKSQRRYIHKNLKNEDVRASQQEAQFAEPAPRSILPTRHTQAQREARPRTFYLSASPRGGNKKRKEVEDGIATFTEQKKTKQDLVEQVQAEDARQAPAVSPELVVASTLKRPGKGSATRTTRTEPTKPETEEERRHVQALADYMLQSTLEEPKREPKPVERESRPAAKAVAVPKLSGPGARAMHQRRVVANGDKPVDREATPESEDDFVYDTYILAPSSDLGAMEVDEAQNDNNVGYLVIGEEQQDLWQTYLEDDPSDKETYSDDEDENAEDYYGADYPEDEVASDDEFDRNPYDYRGRAEDDEEWDADTGEHSDDEDEYERMMNPFQQHKTPAALAKYLQDGDDSG